MQRRKFLGFMVASPFAAKATAEAALEQTGFSILKKAPSGLIQGLSGQGEVGVLSTGGGNISLLRKMAAKFSLSKKLPAFKEFEVIEMAQQYQGLDPDLAALVSVSVSHKVKTQKARNIDRCRAQVIRRLTRHAEQQIWSNAMKKKTGDWIDWY